MAVRAQPSFALPAVGGALLSGWMIALQHLAKVRQVREFFLEFLAFLSNF